MTYIDAVRQALREELPGIGDDLLDLYTLLALTTGKQTNLENVHDAWSVWTNLFRPDHRSLVPFAELSEQVQELDRKYAEAIIKVAK